MQLVIEVDGPIHQRPDNIEYDKEREAYLASCCIRVVRFTNKEVLYDIERVIKKLTTLTTSPIGFAGSPFWIQKGDRGK